MMRTKPNTSRLSSTRCKPGLEAGSVDANITHPQEQRYQMELDGREQAGSRYGPRGDLEQEGACVTRCTNHEDPGCVKLGSRMLWRDVRGCSATAHVTSALPRGARAAGRGRMLEGWIQPWWEGQRHQFVELVITVGGTSLQVEVTTGGRRGADLSSGCCCPVLLIPQQQKGSQRPMAFVPSHSNPTQGALIDAQHFKGSIRLLARLDRCG